MRRKTAWKIFTFGVILVRIFPHLDWIRIICPVVTSLRNLYGNFKVHQTVVNNIPKLQSILSTFTAPTYLLARHANFILPPLNTNEYTVKNSFDFGDNIFSYNHNLYLASLDVESWFTSIPLEETTNY